MEILDVVAYLRLIAFDDDLSFKRIVNTPRRKFGRTRIAALENIRENNDFNLFDFDDENETKNNKFKRSNIETILVFYDILKKNKINVTIRKEFGSLIDAACGQLRAKKMEE